MWPMGSKQKVIAQTLGIVQGKVSNVLKKNRETGVPTPKARPGPSRKTTEREDRYLSTFVPKWAYQVSKRPSC